MNGTWCCYILLLVLNMDSSSLVFSQPCPYEDKRCVCSGSKLVCTNLDSVPALKSNNTNIDTLIFLNGSISSIQCGSLPPNLVSITFENADISDIAEGAFSSSAATLRELNFNKLQLPGLPTALMAIHNLTSLTVSNTPTYNNYNSTLMQHLGKSLRVLKLVSNRMSDYPVWLQYFTSLEEFNMYGNLITALQPNTLSFLSSSGTLRAVNLGFMSMFAISNSFSGLSLTDLVLSRNNLGLNMTDLEISLSPIAKTLQKLYLDSNALSSLPSTISTMDKLLLLDVSSNLIVTIPSNSFPQTLRYLYLQDNRVLQITDTSFPGGSQLRTLNLNNNPLNVTTPLAFHALQQLKVLLLHDTRLVTIPISLSALTQLETLDLTFIPNMKCYCPRGQLVEWYRELANLTVAGSCEAYDSDYSYDINLYLQMSGYKILCSGVTSIVSGWRVCLMMMLVFVVTFMFD